MPVSAVELADVDHLRADRSARKAETTCSCRRVSACRSWCWRRFSRPWSHPRCLTASTVRCTRPGEQRKSQAVDPAYWRSATQCALQENRLRRARIGGDPYGICRPDETIRAGLRHWPAPAARLIGDARQALGFAEHDQHFEDAGRCGAAGERRPQRLRHRAEFGALALGERRTACSVASAVHGSTPASAGPMSASSSAPPVSAALSPCRPMESAGRQAENARRQ